MMLCRITLEFTFNYFLGVNQERQLRLLMRRMVLGKELLQLAATQKLLEWRNF